MTIRDLKLIISGLPDDMEITEQRYSDARLMDFNDWSIIEAYPHEKRGYIEIVTREEIESDYHSDKSEESKLRRFGIAGYEPEKFKKYLFFKGN